MWGRAENMEPPKGFVASLWNFICFLPFFIGLLLLGLIKGKSGHSFLFRICFSSFFL